MTILYTNHYGPYRFLRKIERWDLPAHGSIYHIEGETKNDQYPKVDHALLHVVSKDHILPVLQDRVEDDRYEPVSVSPCGKFVAWVTYSDLGEHVLLELYEVATQRVVTIHQESVYRREGTCAIFGYESLLDIYWEGDLLHLVTGQTWSAPYSSQAEFLLTRTEVPFRTKEKTPTFHSVVVYESDAFDAENFSILVEPGTTTDCTVSVISPQKDAPHVYRDQWDWKTLRPWPQASQPPPLLQAEPVTYTYRRKSRFHAYRSFMNEDGSAHDIETTETGFQLVYHAPDEVVDF